MSGTPRRSSAGRDSAPAARAPAPPDGGPPEPEVASARSLQQLSALETGCRRCGLYRDATQVVPGRGSRRARLMLVGEQPGDREDLAGEPFVGPAGRVLADALQAAGIEPERVFVTNAVKHFKFEQRGKRRLHKKPRASEIDACNVWLQREMELVAPRVVVAMGATAARALLGRSVGIARERGRAITLKDDTALWVTIHPSYLLRLRDAESRAQEFERFVQDLAAARRAQ